MTADTAQEAWYRRIAELRKVCGEPIGWAGSHGPTGHCIAGRHHHCFYQPGGQLWPETVLSNGDTYACPCQCHDHQHEELP